MGNRKYTVYMHVSPNEKRYIGVTSTSAKERWMNGAGYSTNVDFQTDIKKYGWDSFEHLIIADGLSCRAAAKMEQDLIAKYHSNSPQFGYNKTKGGETREMYNPNRKKMVLLNLQMTESEKAQLRHDAHQHDMNVSEYVRWLIQKERESDAAMA